MRKLDKYDLIVLAFAGVILIGILWFITYYTKPVTPTNVELASGPQPTIGAAAQTTWPETPAVDPEFQPGDYVVRSTPNVEAPQVGTIQPTCADIAPSAIDEIIPAEGGAWVPIRGGWVLNDGWCV